MAGTIVSSKAVKREKGYLYFVDASGNVRKTKMNRKGGKKGHRTCTAPRKKTVRKSAKKRAVKKTAKRRTKKR